MYSVQDERLDLKRKSSSVYIVESDNDFFFVVLFKHINNSVRPFRFFFPRCCYCRDDKREGENGCARQQSHQMQIRIKITPQLNM